MKNYAKRNLIISLMINLLIIAFEIIGAVLSIRRRGVEVFVFYTEISNYFTLIISSMFAVSTVWALKFNKKIPAWIHIIRFMSTVCLTITLTVVVFVLIPMSPDMWLFLLFEDSNIYQHLLCPILSMVSFVLFENVNMLHKKALFYALIPTVVYGCILIALNICKAIVGPYPFFLVYEFAWYVIVLLLVGIVLGAYLTALIIYSIHNKLYKRNKTVVDFL